MLIQTPEPGWKATIYAAPQGRRARPTSRGWTKVGGGTVAKRKQRFTLDTGGQAVPLLPDLDHRAAAGRDQGRDQPASIKTLNPS